MRSSDVQTFFKDKPKPKKPRTSLRRVSKRLKNGDWSNPADLAVAKEIVRERSGGWCEANAPGCLGRATNVHHRAGRGFRGCHHPSLLGDYCGNGNTSGCHGYAHTHHDEAEEQGWILPWGTKAEDLDEWGQLPRAES